jgi:hypothetical protein
MAPVGAMAAQFFQFQLTGFNPLLVGAAVAGALGYQFYDKVQAQLTPSKQLYAGSMALGYVFGPSLGLGDSPFAGLAAGAALGYVLNKAYAEALLVADDLAKAKAAIDQTAEIEQHVSDALSKFSKWL